jgi:transposase
MYYIGLDVHKKTISFCVKDAAGHGHQEGKVGSTRRELNAWIQTLPEPRMIAMEATIFTGWIYDYLLPHAEKVKVAHPVMLRAIAAAKKKNDKIDARKSSALTQEKLNWKPTGPGLIADLDGMDYTQA